MQKLSIIFLAFLLSVTVTGQKTIIQPKIRDIVTEFYSNYSTDYLEYPRVIFEKRKEGWYVITQRINKNKLDPVNKALFYDNILQQYKPLSIEKNTEKKQINPPDYLPEFDLRNYDAQFYYGYKGWYKDVIGEFENKKKLSDDELNGIARAYSTYAAALLSDQYGDALPDEVWQLPLTMNCLSAKQIEEFNFLESKAQEYFKKLADINPEYETVVGKIGMKYANEVMFQFTVLLAYANNYAVKMKLPGDLYSKEQLDQAKSILEHCPANAIFLSFGDNDYYPLHYVQHAMGIRKDVYVLNYSLIGLDRYIYQASHPQYSADAITINADTSLYAGNNQELIYVVDSSYSIDFSKLIKLMEYGTKDEWGRITLKADVILLDGDNHKTISIKNAPYIFKSQWILLDILNNLKGRKICFSYNFNDELSGLNDYLLLTDGLYIYNN